MSVFERIQKAVHTSETYAGMSLDKQLVFIAKTENLSPAALKEELVNALDSPAGGNLKYSADEIAAAQQSAVAELTPNAKTLPGKSFEENMSQ